MFQDLKPYDTYASHAHPWIPAFPTAWAVTPGAGVLSEVHTRNDGLRETTVLSLSYGRVIIKPSDKFHGLVPASYETYQILEPGDIVFRPTDLQNDQRSIRVGAVGERGIITSAYIGLRPRGIDPQFAFLYLRALDYLKVFYGMGSGLRQNIDFRDFKRLPIAVPPAEEQCAIVTYLAHAHQRINKTIATKHRLIALLTEQAQRVREHALGGGTHDADGTKHPLLGRLPRTWEAIRLKWIVDPLTQGWSPQADAQPAGPDEWGVVKAGCANGGRFRPEENKRLPATVVPRPELEIRDGDLLISRANTLKLVGSAALVRDPRRKLMLCDKIFRTHVHEDRAVPEFVAEVLQSSISRFQIENGASGASHSMQNIGQGVIRELVLPLPPLAEQLEILQEIAVETTRVRTAVGRVHREIGLLEEFRTRLTADVVMGQVDVRSVAATLPPIDLTDMLAAPLGADDVDDEEAADEATMEDE